MSTATTRVKYREKGTNCPNSRHSFANRTAQKIADRLHKYARGNMCIRGYTPGNMNAAEIPTGYIEIGLEADGADEVTLGIEFGKLDAEKRPHLRQFDHSEWIAHGSRISAFNFDEAWRIVSLVGTLMAPRSISIEYGQPAAAEKPVSD